MTWNTMKRFTILALVSGLVGCAHQNKELNLDILTVEHRDARTDTKEVYSGYLDTKGRLVRHGAYVDYYRNGNKYVEGEYSHGKLHGEWRVYTHEGQIYLAGRYRDGKPWDGLFQAGDHVVRYSNGVFSGYVTNLLDPSGTNPGHAR